MFKKGHANEAARRDIEERTANLKKAQVDGWYVAGSAEDNTEYALSLGSGNAVLCWRPIRDNFVVAHNMANDEEAGEFAMDMESEGDHTTLTHDELQSLVDQIGLSFDIQQDMASRSR